MHDLSLIGGVVISLALSYIPGLSDWYNKQDGTVKRSILAVAIVIVAIAIVLGSCADIPMYGNEVTCDKAGVMAVVTSAVTALVSSQGTYLFTHKE